MKTRKEMVNRPPASAAASRRRSGSWIQRRVLVTVATSAGTKVSAVRTFRPRTPTLRRTHLTHRACVRGVGVHRTSEVLGSLPVSFGDSYTQAPDGRMLPYDLDRVSSLMCSGCKQATAVVEEKWIGDHPAREGIQGGGTVKYRGVHWWPPPSSADLDESIPGGLRDSYAEAMRALSARAPRAAAVMLRRTVEGLVRESGSAAARNALDRNLAAGLRVMADEHALDANLASPLRPRSRTRRPRPGAGVQSTRPSAVASI